MVGNRKEYLLKLLEDNKNMDKIAVLIPCYNEAKTIAKVVSDFKREIPASIVIQDSIPAILDKCKS